MEYILPLLITAVIIVSESKRRKTYSDFLNGAAEGLEMLKNIFPALVGVMTAAAMLRASGAMDLAVRLIAPLSEAAGIPAEVVPIAIIRPVSGGGSLGILSSILNQYGADSYIGRTASVIMGSTETTFYCISVYYASAKAKPSVFLICTALFCDMVSAAAAAWFCRIF